MIRLITIPFSHYCEKVRWALDWAGPPYVEEGHLPLLHWAATRRAGGGRTAPVLVTAERVIGDSTEILRWIDERARAEHQLYPGSVAARALELEERFDADLGPHARRVAYYHSLSDRNKLRGPVEQRVPRWELVAMRMFWPLAVAMLRRGLRIDDAGAARSLVKVDAVFADVDALLADGRRYLTGDRMSAADITFAALAAPLLLPEGHPVPLTVEGWPQAFTALRDRLRATRAGMHALRLYSEERAVSSSR